MSLFDNLAKEMVRIMEQSEPMKQAQLSLITKKESKSQREVWLAIYHNAIHRKLFKPIEDLDKQEKADLKAFGWELCKDKGLSMEEIVQVCRCLVTIEYYLQKYGKQ